MCLRTHRWRRILVEPSLGGRPCQGAFNETRACTHAGRQEKMRISGSQTRATRILAVFARTANSLSGEGGQSAVHRAKVELSHGCVKLKPLPTMEERLAMGCFEKHKTRP
eukprot:g22189.t1